MTALDRWREKWALGCFGIAALGACASKPVSPPSQAPEENDTYISYWKSTSRDVAAPKNYTTIGDCDGFPRIDVSTAPGFCVGLVHNGEGMVMPRGVVAAGDDLLIADMGGWVENRGKIFRLVRQGAGYELKIALDAKTLPSALKPALDRPHSLVLSQDGKIYIGAATAISRFDPAASKPEATLEILLKGLPGDGRHPLKNLALDGTDFLYVNIGSKSDNCEGAIQGKTCTEAEGPEARGVIRRYRFLPTGKLDPAFEVVARGLRNSMSLAIHPTTRELYQGENSRDLINKADPRLDDEIHPPEELNLVVPGSHYGWPYCYDKNRISPEFKGQNCSRFAPPHLIWPAHAAPLGMLFYDGRALPEWYQGKLIVAFHGYRKFGHRVVAFEADAQGRPSGKPLSLVYGWDAKGTNPLGTPTGLTVASDGSLIVTEDKNRKVLRVAYDPAQGSGLPVAESETPISLESVTRDRAALEARRKADMEKRLSLAPGKVPLFTQIQSKLINKYCVSCHGGENNPGISLYAWDDIGNAERLIEAREGRSPLVIPRKPAQSELYLRMQNKGFPPMPPAGFENADEAKRLTLLMKKWIEAGAPAPGSN